MLYTSSAEMLKLYLRTVRNRSLQVVFRRQIHKNYSGKTLPFSSRNWLVHPQKFKYLPKSEQDTTASTVIPLQFEKSDNKANNGNIYLEDKEFRENLDKALTQAHSNLLIGYTNYDIFSANATWMRLRELLYYQLSHISELQPLSSFQLTAPELLKPTNPGDLLNQLLSVNQIPDHIWKSVLEKEEYSVAEQYYFILKNFYYFIRNQEIEPQTRPSWSDVDSGLDISNPSEWFPEARKLKRTIIMHIGPTNSGKTYNALQKLKQCQRGYYAGPLRLLAREVYDKFQSDGIRCNLLTGEEVIEDLDSMGNRAGLTSGTVEMIPLNEEFDVCVLDEVQMVGDKERGWAWTNAILGIQASEIHLCGEESVLPLMNKIVKLTGDTLVVNKYKRLGTLEIEHQPLAGKFKGLKAGDCVIAFSKKTILDLKLTIERQTDLKVAVIYGSLPPETRVKQAKLFNSGEYDVLVASDAIGMGLNLSINRVIFTSAEKFNGVEVLPLTFSNIKQIGGRAGRYKPPGRDNSGDGPSVGHITALDYDTLRAVRRGINAPVQFLEKAVVWPTDDLINNLISYYPPGTKVSVLLKKFQENISSCSNKMFELSNIVDRVEALSTFEDMRGLTLWDKLKLSNAPIRLSPLVSRTFNSFCKTIAERSTTSLLNYNLPFVLLHRKFIKDESVSLQFYEEFHQVINLYCWLHIRYPQLFVDYESAIDLKNLCEMIIFKKLEFLKQNPYRKTLNSNQTRNPRFQQEKRRHNLPFPKRL